MFKKTIRQIIPEPIIEILRTIKYFFADNYELYFGLRDKLTPPSRMIFIGGRNFKQIGENFKQVGEMFLKYFIEIGGLKTSDHILDVGCGIGRMAVPITRYLSKEGSYEGIDIVADGINWCNKNITTKYSNFRFQVADIYSKRYNPKGKYKSLDYKFPFEDNAFDFVFLTSVFTHMLPHDMENYLSEISRVLRKDGKCFITYFLLNQESLNQNKKKPNIFNFNHDFGDYRVENKDIPESAVSYDENFVLKLYDKYSLRIIEPIRYGSWCGRKDHLSFQDIIVAEKK